MIDVKEVLQDSQDRMEMAAMYLEEQLSRVRAGRANVAILDGVRVQSYGMTVPLNQVANVSAPDARTIAIRLGIPQPAEERRRELAKRCDKIGEKTKIEVRNVRAEIKDKLKKAIKDGLSEDNEKDAEEQLQKLHDKFIKKIDDLLEAKNKEIMTV